MSLECEAVAAILAARFYGEHWEVEVPADDRVPSTYYSPPRILALIQPERWPGAFLVEAADELAARGAAEQRGALP